MSVTEDFIEYLTEGAVAIEVYGHRQADAGRNPALWDLSIIQAKTRTLRDRWGRAPTLVCFSDWRRCAADVAGHWQVERGHPPPGAVDSDPRDQRERRLRPGGGGPRQGRADRRDLPAPAGEDQSAAIPRGRGTERAGFNCASAALFSFFLCYLQGQSRRIQVDVRSVQDSGTMPLISEVLLAVSVGCVEIRNTATNQEEDEMDSYQVGCPLGFSSLS